MKAHTNYQTTGDGFRENNTQYSQTPTDMYYAQGTTNNLNSKSPRYQGMNTLVIYLDTLYKSLLPSTREAWEAASGEYGPEYLCGCTQSVWNGQKLFRIVNYGLQITGNPVNTEYPPDPETGTASPGAIFYYHTGFGGGEEIWIGTPIQTDDSYLCFQFGEGLMNPVYKLLSGTGIRIIPTTWPGWLQLWNHQNDSPITICTWGSNFCPRPVTIWPCLIEN